MPEKSAEEWDNIWKQKVEAWIFNLRRPPQALDNEFHKWIKSIQRNAKHAAMLEAETLVQKERNTFKERNHNHGFKTARARMSQSILTAAEKYKD